MKTTTNYSSNQARGILLIGCPGSGKTTLASQLSPPAYIADCDNNLVGAVRLSKEPFFYDTINIADDGSIIPPHSRWERLCKCTAEACKTENIKSVVVDSLTLVSDYLIDYIMHKNNRHEMRIQDWGEFKNLMAKFIVALRASGKLIIVTAHERYVKDEMTGILQYSINVPGQTADIIGAYFSDVWRCEALSNEKNQRQFFIRTVPNARITGLKDSAGNSGLVEVNLEKLRETIL